MPTFYLVELFSGSSSVAKAAETTIPNGWDFKTHSLDIHPKYNPTTTTDILKWDYKPVLREFLYKARPGDVVWVHASPPCTEYSIAKTTAPRNLPLADRLVKRALRIVSFCMKLSANGQNFFWTVENPVGLLRTRGFMKRLDPYRNTTSYCKWGKRYRKNTDIWTNVATPDLPVCIKGAYCKAKEELGYHPSTAQTGGNYNFVNGKFVLDPRMTGSRTRENVYPLPKKLVVGLIRAAFKNGSVSKKDIQERSVK